MKCNVLIIDDEVSARSRMRKLLAEFPDLAVVGEAADGLAAIGEIVRLRPDLIFLDVQMPGLSGFEVLRGLPADCPRPLVIFATAYDEFALAAFEEHALGYLLKPVNRNRLRPTIERAVRLMENREESVAEVEKITRATAALAPVLKQVVVRKRDRFMLLPVEEAFVFHIDGGLVRVKTAAAEYWTDYQLGDLAERLPEADFFRAHRSAIVNLRHVAEIVPHFRGTFLLILRDSSATEIQVSERQSKQLRALLNL